MFEKSDFLNMTRLLLYTWLHPYMAILPYSESWIKRYMARPPYITSSRTLPPSGSH